MRENLQSTVPLMSIPQQATKSQQAKPPKAPIEERRASRLASFHDFRDQPANNTPNHHHLRPHAQPPCRIASNAFAPKIFVSHRSFA